MQTRQNSQATTIAHHHITGQGDYEFQRTDRTQPYETLDPFNPSISLKIRNSRRQDTINSVDEIELPLSFTAFRSPRTLRTSRESYRSGRGLDSGVGGAGAGGGGREEGTGRVSFESIRSQVLQFQPQVQGQGQAQVQGQVQTQGWGQPRSPTRLVEVESRVNTGYGSPHPRPSDIAIPARRNAMDLYASAEASGGYENGYQPSQIQNGNGMQGDSSQQSTLRPPPRRSFSLFSFHYRPRDGSYFSEAFLPTHDEEKAAGTPSAMYHSSRTGSQGQSLKLYIITFLTSILPHQIYLHCLLRLPYMYFSRVTQIFENANLTLGEMKDMALKDCVDTNSGQIPAPEMPRGYLRLKKNWEQFIDNLMREWKTLNIISGLLLSGILTIFQIDGAQSDPITRYMAFWSLISALLSLLYGCIFIIRFSGMRRVYQATEWAIEAQRQHKMFFWNVWIILSMPAIWLVWSILAYIACIMSFMWRVRQNQPDIVPPRVGSATDAGFRIFICCVLGVGVVYAILIINTLRHYGSKMDRRWSERIDGFRSQQASKPPPEEPITPVLSPLVEMEIIEPTPPLTFSRLPSSPASAFVPSRPSPPIRPTSTRRPHSPPSPSPLGHFPPLSQMNPIFSASRTRMTPDTLESPPSAPQNISPVEVPETPRRRGGWLGLTFDGPGGPDGPPSSDPDDGGLENMAGQRGTDGDITEPESVPTSGGTTLAAEQDQPEESDVPHCLDTDERNETRTHQSDQ